jgi:hypothetical protein
MDMSGPEKIFQTGSLAAKTSRLPPQPLTSHPSIKGELDKGNLSISATIYADTPTLHDC